MEEINAERQNLLGLFMTPSGKRIEALRNQGVFVDADSGELAWPVYECTNANCPGRVNGESHLFIWPDPRFYAADDGTLGSRQFDTIQQWREAVVAEGGDREPTCHKCLEIRDLANETPEEGQQYSQYPKIYVLPSTAERMKQLDAEHQTRIDYINRRVRGE